MCDNNKICVLVVDLGTSNMKVMAFDTVYNVVASCCSPIKTIRDNGLAEQHADDWMRALTKCLQTVCPTVIKNGYHVAGIGFTGHMSTPVFVDRNKNVIAPIQTLTDQRCSRQVAHISQAQRCSITRATGNVPAPYFTLPKILWALQNDGALSKNTRAILTPKDYIRLQLGGGFYSECSDCCNTLLLDYNTLDWHNDNVQNIGIDKNILPTLRKSSDLDGVLSPAWSHRLQLPRNIPLVMGASDMATAFISCRSNQLGTNPLDTNPLGTNQPTTIGVTMGTSATVTMGCHTPIRDLQGKVTFHISAQDTLFVLGSHFNGGACVDWFHNIVQGRNMTRGKFLNPEQKHRNLRTLIKKALSTDTTLNDPIFIPHLLGSGSPDFNPDACGVFAQLRATHTHTDMMRAVLEGITADVGKTIRLLQQNTLHPCHIIAGAGGIYLENWPQMLADMTGLTVKVPDNPQSSALGCAVITYHALGIKAQQKIPYKTHNPHPQKQKLYKNRLKQQGRDFC